MIVGTIKRYVAPESYGALVDQAIRDQNIYELSRLAREMAIKLASAEAQCDFILNELRLAHLTKNQQLQAVRDE